MRVKDDEKRQALFEATIQLVNEVGFASSSVSKIAKVANVSPSTLYIYHKNKEDLLVSAYMEVKREMAAAFASDFDDTAPIRDILHNAWFSLFEYTNTNPKKYRYAEQFSNSPYLTLADHEELEKHFSPLLAVIHRGVEQKIIKEVECELLVAYLFQPVPFLADVWNRKGRHMNEEEMETAFTMAWDAIKL